MGYLNDATDNSERCLAKVKAQGASANFLARLEDLLHNGTRHVSGQSPMKTSSYDSLMVEGNCGEVDRGR